MNCDRKYGLSPRLFLTLVRAAEVASSQTTADQVENFVTKHCAKAPKTSKSPEWRPMDSKSAGSVDRFCAIFGQLLDH